MTICVIFKNLILGKYSRTSSEKILQVLKSFKITLKMFLHQNKSKKILKNRTYTLHNYQNYYIQPKIIKKYLFKLKINSTLYLTLSS